VAQWVALILHRAELVTILAHDLRMPLVPMQGYLRMMQHTAKQEGHEQYQRSVSFAQRSVRRMERMLSNVLDSTRLDQGIFILKLDMVNLGLPIEETAELPRSPTTSINVRARQDLVAVVDADRLWQALDNLISNALRYTPEGIPVVVDVTTERHEDGTTCSRGWLHAGSR
jgi:two-component system OmpR family sensor kinase